MNDPKNHNFLKIVRSDKYNYVFNLKNGFFARWGKTEEDNPEYSPLGPELLDIEVSTVCHNKCSWCYKSNISKGKNMDFKIFKAIFDKIPKNLTQIAFGIGDLDANPDLWKMFEYCCKNRVIPNITINGYKINEDIAEKLAKYCGAVAVSHYNDDFCFNAIKLLADKSLKQVNIHKLVAKETLKSCYRLLQNVKNDIRLKNLNAIIFLSLKKKGRGTNFHITTQKEFSKLVQFALKQKIHIGFDSCSAAKFLNTFINQEKKNIFEVMIEPCESCCFSLYINVDGIAYPCSFLEGENGYNGINILKTDNFLEDVWFKDSISLFRKKLIMNQRCCPHFKI